LVLYFFSFEDAYFLYVLIAIIAVMMTKLVVIPISTVISSLILIVIFMFGENTQTKLSYTNYIVSIILVFLTVFLVCFVDNIKNKATANVAVGLLIFFMLFIFSYFRIESWLLILFLLAAFFSKPFDIHIRMITVFASISILVSSTSLGTGGVNGFFAMLAAFGLTFVFFYFSKQDNSDKAKKESFDVEKLLMSVIYMVLGFFGMLIFLFVLFRVLFF
jgi:hypothetical protein